jgi:hypothetical protein
MDPKYIEVTGFFTPRGGISIYPYANYGRPGTKYEALGRKTLRISRVGFIRDISPYKFSANLTYSVPNGTTFVIISTGTSEFEARVRIFKRK